MAERIKGIWNLPKEYNGDRVLQIELRDTALCPGSGVSMGEG